MARFARQKPIRSGGAGRKRGVGKMNARPALASAAAKIRANSIGTPQNIYFVGSTTLPRNRMFPVSFS